MVNNSTFSAFFSVAPMLDWTNRYYRYFLRLISRRSLLYTEMITTGALLHGSHHRHLAFDLFEKPLVLQLGGSNPPDLAQCAKMAADYGYDEINLNVGCPSSRVKNGRFGACLMAEPELVAECVAAMRQRVNIPITVKTRIGIDNDDSYESLCHFLQTVAQAGCQTFIIHARKAWLNGLSPKENREIPPLRYDIVYRVAENFPFINFVMNGGITSLVAAEQHLPLVAGVMLGRAICQDVYILNEVDQRFYNDSRPTLTRHQLIESYAQYAAQQLSERVPLAMLIRPTLSLFQGIAGARQWRRHLSENAHLPQQTATLLLDAMKHVREENIA